VRFLVAFLICVALSSTIFSPQSFAQNKYWVFFKDKPNARVLWSISKSSSNRVSDVAAGQHVETAKNFLVDNGILTQRAINRRLKTLLRSSIISISDFPVYVPYLDSLRSVGLTVDGTSRWFNAAVVVADSAQLVEAERFPFVIGLKRVLSSISRGDEIRPMLELPRMPMGVSPQPGDSSFYGPSYEEFELSGIPKVHSLDVNGSGVLMGMLDAGFRYETHDALKNIKIVGEHDFIQNDSITANQQGDTPDQDSHGTMTLSLLGAYSPENLVGVTYGSEFMLAKTELIYPDPGDVDYKSEEDNWVEGIEWMEGRGVDVVSSSLGYNIFVDSSGDTNYAESYFWSRGDFNGKTALASRAATRAAELGVVVVNAMGNEYNGNGTVGTMDVPADADSIISVGAVGLDSLIADFSSTGPTNDGRIKPDLVADGVNNYVADVPGPDTYTIIYSGTSFSTPITAGVAGLVLSIRPDLTPMQVIDLLKSTAVKVNDPNLSVNISGYPNNFYGWGIVNAWNAIQCLASQFTFWHEDSVTYLAIRAFSTPGIDIGLSAAYYSINNSSYTKVPVFAGDTAGKYIFEISSPISVKDQVSFYFDLVDSSSNHVAWLYHNAQSPLTVSGATLYPGLISENFVLFTNYPNPFNSQTHIGVILKNDSHVSVDIFDIIGRKIKAVFNGEKASGYQEFTWDARADGDHDVSSGVYLVRVDVGGSIKVVKALYLK
jgi:hypothetical protein